MQFNPKVVIKFVLPIMFSVQALYFCVPFRDQLLEYCGQNKTVPESEENLLTCLSDLFTQVFFCTPFSYWSTYVCYSFYIMFYLLDMYALPLYSYIIKNFVSGQTNRPVRLSLKRNIYYL